MKRLAFVLFVTLPLFSQDLSGYQKVLFPMFNAKAVQGANGAVFYTSLQALAPKETVLSWGTPAQTIPGASQFPTAIAYPDSEGASHGRIAFLPQDANVSFGYALSFYAPSIGYLRSVPLPVVRECDLRTGPSSIFDMGTSPNYDFSTGLARFNGTFQERHTLRIYDVDNTGRLSVDVTFTAYPPYYGSDAMHIDANRREGNDAGHPVFGERTFDGICVRSGMYQQCTGTQLFVTITPNDPTIRYYAMLTTTDNVTQAVTILVPQ